MAPTVFTECDGLFYPRNFTNPHFVNFRTGQSTMRNSASRWEYMRSHISSKSADLIMRGASEIGKWTLQPDIVRPLSWYQRMMNINSCGLTTQVVYISPGLNNIFKAFFTVSINLEGEHFELSSFFAHFSATFSGHQTYSVCNSCKTNLWAKKIDPEQPIRTVCHKRLKSLQWCWNQRFGKYLIRSNISPLERFISGWPKRVKVT